MDDPVTRTARKLGTFAVAALIVLATPLRAQQAADSADRADSLREDSLWHARLRKTKGAAVAAPLAAPVVAPVAAPVVAPVAAPVVQAKPPVSAPVPPAHVDSVKPAPALAPVAAPVATPVAAPIAAPVVAPVVQAAPPVPAPTQKAPVDTAARAHADSVKPAPVEAPVMDADAAERARMDSAQAAKWGQYVFKNRQCEGCHELGRDQSSGPNLVGVTDRRTLDWLRKWLKNPTTMTGDDPVAMALKKKYGSQMPDLQLSTRDIEGLLVYLARETHARSGR